MSSCGSRDTAATSSSRARKPIADGAVAVQFGLSAKIGAVDSKLTFLGTILGLALALLAALTGIGVFQRLAPSLGEAATVSDAQPVSTVAPGLFHASGRTLIG